MAGAFLTVIMAFTLLPVVVFAENANAGVAKIGDQTYDSVAKQLQRLVQMLQQLN